jgi:transposase
MDTILSSLTGVFVQEKLMALSKQRETDILRYYFAEQWRIGTIARQLGLHHSTVERVIAQAGIPKPERTSAPSIIDPYLPFIVETLQQYPSLSACRVYQMAVERGYPGGSSHFRQHVAQLRPKKLPEAFLRLKTLPAEQGQVDWGHFGHLPVGRAKRQLMAFVMVLSHSRRIFVQFFLNARTGPFLQGHVNAFEQWQGVPRILLYDNLKSAVLSRQGRAIEFNPTLLELAAHYRFEPRPVAVARGNEKGRVERAIRYIRDNFFAGRTWSDLDDLNAQALAWSQGLAMDRPCPEDTGQTVRQVFEQEQGQLIALPDNPFPAEEKLAVSVGKTPFVRFDLNDYSVPHPYVRHNLTVLADEQQVRIINEHQTVAIHPRHYGKGEQIVQDAHLEALVQYKRQAKGHSGQHRLQAACPQTEQLLQRSIERGHTLSMTVRRLLESLEDYGNQAFCEAVNQALASDSPHASAVAQILQCEREKQRQPPPLSIPIENPKARVQLKAPSLASYKSLSCSDENSGETS